MNVRISLGNTLFDVTDEAYRMLKKSIDEVVGFSSGEQRIVLEQDIENRIAEYFTQNFSAEHVIDVDDVSRALIAIGLSKVSPDDFDLGLAHEQDTSANGEDTNEQNTSTASNRSKQSTSRRKLYRSTNNKIIAGVCGGLADYAKVDPIWIRILMLISLVNGFGAAIYILMWLITPKEATGEALLNSQTASKNGCTVGCFVALCIVAILPMLMVGVVVTLFIMTHLFIWH